MQEATREDSVLEKRECPVEISHPEGGNTAATDETSPMEDPLSASLWLVNGSESEEVMAEASIYFDQKSDVPVLVLKGLPSEGHSKEVYEFRCDCIHHFRQHQEDMCQWIFKKSADDFMEFGAVFTTKEQASVFAEDMQSAVISTGQSVGYALVEFREYDKDTKVWVCVEEAATLHVLEREMDKQYFLLVVSGSGDDHPLSFVPLSQHDYIFPQPSEGQVTWWGTFCGWGPTKLFSAFFVDPSTADPIYEQLDCIMKEQLGNGQMEEYDEEAFDSGIQDDVDMEEMEWADDDAAAHTTKGGTPSTSEGSSMVNKLMEVGSERTFVVRNSESATKKKTEMLVFGFDEFGSERVVATVGDSKFDYNDMKVDPKRVLLHNGESKMVIIDEADNDHLYMMDIEHEKIVQHWDANHMKVMDIAPVSRGAQKSHAQCVVAYNPQAVFNMDLRQNQHARGHTISYASKVDFTCGATDKDGHILMGSKLGQFRLYDGTANSSGDYKRAKTQLSGLGDPLLHVSITDDGSWILGTCAKYLVLFPVRLTDSGKSGFVTALGKRKPKPIILKLTFEDICKYNLEKINFSKADFDTFETTIVTATGNLVIIWDFVAIKRGQYNCYSIRSMDECVRDVAFMRTESSERVVMATPSTISARPLKRKTVNTHL